MGAKIVILVELNKLFPKKCYLKENTPYYILGILHHLFTFATDYRQSTKNLKSYYQHY